MDESATNEKTAQIDNTSSPIQIITADTNDEANRKDLEKAADENEAIKDDTNKELTHVVIFLTALCLGIYGWVMWLLLCLTFLKFFFKSDPVSPSPIEMGMYYFVG